MRSASSTVRLTFCSTSRTVAPALPDLRQRLEDLVDQDAARGPATAHPAGAGAARRPAHGRSRAAAARRREGARGQAVGLAQDREALEHPLERRACARAVALRSCAERQVLAHRERREDVPALHDEGDPASGDVLRGRRPGATRRGTRPRRRRSGRARRSPRARRLAGAVRADETDDLAFARPRGRGAGWQAPIRSERSRHGHGASIFPAPR